MTANAQKVFEEALTLTADEREEIAARLFDSLEESDPQTQSEWNAEIARRVVELETGEVKAIPWPEARRMIFGDPKDGPES